MARRTLIIISLVVGFAYFLRSYNAIDKSNDYDGDIAAVDSSTPDKRDIRSKRTNISTAIVNREDKIQNNVQKIVEEEIGDRVDWIEPIASIGTFNWIFSKLGGNPQEIEKRKKYEKNPYGILLTKLNDLKEGQLIELDFPEILIDIYDAYGVVNNTIFYHDGKVVDSGVFNSKTDKPMCAVTFIGRKFHKNKTENIYFFVGRVEHPIDRGSDFIGTRINSKQIGDVNEYLHVSKVECFFNRSTKSYYQMLNITHLYITLGYNPVVF